jgi:beta-phosphoglucomutase-like phosphatase (HAD superfamily)
MNIRAVFFDLDGTLVDSNEFHVVAWARALSDNNFTVPRHAIREQIGKGTDQLIPALLPHLDESSRKALGDAHEEIFQRHFRKLVAPFHRAKELVARVAGAGAKVLFASSSKQNDVDYYANLLEATPFLTDTTCVDDVTKSKPAGDIFSSALKKAGVTPNEALVIGDTPYDAIAAAK